MANPTPTSTALLIDGYGQTHVTHEPAADNEAYPLIKVSFERMRRRDLDDGIEGAWELQLFPDEALRLISAIADHVRQSLNP